MECYTNNSSHFPQRGCKNHLDHLIFGVTITSIQLKLRLYNETQISLSKESRDELSEILKDAKTYINYSVPRDCLFRPGVAFHFAKQNRKVDVLVCFSCNELRYYLNDKIVGQSYFKSERLSKLTKKLFPDDKIIQSMK